jgi:hypothetical protein
LVGFFLMTSGFSWCYHTAANSKAEISMIWILRNSLSVAEHCSRENSMMNLVQVV